MELTQRAGPDPILGEAFEAMHTAMAWNVNWEPRVSVTVPVSRTFEASFSFILFDWDMFFLSLMGASLPAAADNYTFEVAISNLIEVTQTRSVYGQVGTRGTPSRKP